MKYTKSLLAMLMVGMTFTACNEFEDFDAESNNVSHPATIEYGYYTVESASDAANTYGFVVSNCTEMVEDTTGTLVAKNDTLLQVLTINKETGEVRNLANCHNVYYDATTGMLTGVCEESHYEDRLVAALVYDRFGNLTAQVHHAATADDSQSIVYGKATKSTTEVPSFYGTWTIGNEYAFVLLKAGEEVADAEGNPVVVYGVYMDTEVLDYIYQPLTVEGKTASFVSPKGTVTLAYNENMQMVATIGEATLACERAISEPEPETYTEVATGLYVHAVSASFASNAFGQTVPAFLPNYAMAKQYDAVLYQGDRNKNKYLIAPWFNENTAGLAFELTDEELAENVYRVSVPGSGIGMGDSSGELYVYDQYHAFGGKYESVDSNFNFNTNIVEFYHVLATPASYYGIDHDQFIITGDAGAQKKTIKKSLKATKPLQLDKSKAKKLNLNPIF